MNDPSWANAHELSVTRWGLRSRALSRMPPRSSRAIPRQVRSASVTIFFAMQWFDVPGEPGFLSGGVCSSRFADLVCLGLEFAAQVTLPPAVPVQRAAGHDPTVAGGGDVDDAEVDAEEPGRLVCAGLGDVAGRDQEPRCRPGAAGPTRPAGTRASVLSASGEQANRMPRSRPAVVQIYTVARRVARTGTGRRTAARRPAGTRSASTRPSPAAWSRALPRFPAWIFACRVA